MTNGLLKEKQTVSNLLFSSAKRGVHSRLKSELMNCLGYTTGDNTPTNSALLYKLAELIKPELERTGRMEVVHTDRDHDCLGNTYHFTCCDYKWWENACDELYTDLEVNFCPMCGAKIVD